ncbi:MAG: diacylglycerol kinase family lipid kinase [Chloroflexi bacterium]|nr:diacylglycerol kinase family lipid kinase [Chloroflexota bacterium]
MTKTLVILNPISGLGRASKLWHPIEIALRDNGIQFDMIRSQAPYHAISLAEQAKRDGYETLIAVGGDGIVHEVVNGIMRATNGEPDGTLAVIPVGSGNDFAKMLDLKTGEWKKAVEQIAKGNTRWFDVGKITVDTSADDGSHVRYFDNTFDTGFGAQVAKHAHMPILTGMAMYLAAVFKTLADYSVPHLKIKFPDQIIEQKSTMTVATIGRYFGGGFWVAPNAQVDDGLLDVMIAEGLGRIGILSLLPKVMNGTHIGDPRVKFFRAPRIVIESPDPLAVECDGEVPWLDAHRLEIEVLPKRLRVIC